ncbi:MAG: hypothetical protein RLN81_08635 [Balneolaceae bacterium]
MKHQENITIVNPELSFRKVALVPPSKSHYFLFAAEVDSNFSPFYFRTGNKKKKLLAYCKSQCEKIKRQEGIEDVAVFKAQLIPPGKGKLLRERPHVPIAKFDVVVLIEIKDITTASEARSSKYIEGIKEQLGKIASKTLFLMATNERRIDSVDHDKQGVFLFNFFYADNLEQNIGIWEYTAGWFQQETRLDNSTLLLPDNQNKSPFTVINHCRWDSMLDILPSILFKRSFRKFVLDNFYANNVAAIPILYKRA